MEPNTHYKIVLIFIAWLDNIFDLNQFPLMSDADKDAQRRSLTYLFKTRIKNRERKSKLSTFTGQTCGNLITGNRDPK